MKVALSTKLQPAVGLSVVAQKGRKTAEVSAMVKAPSKPARRPVRVTPPFVPGGTVRRVGEVMSRGDVRERIPSSLEKVSAATAA